MNRIPTSGPAARCVLLAALLLAAFARPARAAAVNIILPVVTAAPGATVQIPIDVSPNLSTSGVEAIQYSLTIDPAVVSSVTSLADGLVWTWGTPYFNATPTAVLLATAGVSPIVSTSTRLHTLEFTVSPAAVDGTDMVLSFSLFRFNEGVPAAQRNPGRLRVRSGSADVPPRGPAGFGLSAASPNPLRGSTRFTYSLPPEAAGAGARLAIYGLDGARVRTLHDGATGGGERAASWDARDDAGRRVAPGVYFCALESGGLRAVRRLVVLD